MITYRATLDVPRQVVRRVSRWLQTHRHNNDSREYQRAASCRTQAIMYLRKNEEDAPTRLIALDAGVSRATAYCHIEEAAAVIAAHGMSLDGVLELVEREQMDHVNLDGTLIETNRSREKNTNGHDAWYSGHSRDHGTDVARSGTRWRKRLSGANADAAHHPST